MNAKPTLSYRPSPGDLDRVMRHFGVAEAQARRDFVVSWMLWSISRAARTSALKSHLVRGLNVNVGSGQA